MGYNLLIYSYEFLYLYYKYSVIDILTFLYFYTDLKSVIYLN